MGKVDGDVAINVPPQVYMSPTSITHGVAEMAVSRDPFRHYRKLYSGPEMHRAART